MIWLEKIVELLGSVTVLFLFFSGLAVLIAILLFSKKGNNTVSENRQKRTVEKGAKSGGRSPFGSLCLALAGTLGVGNISGVAAAISVGGAGAVFWMWISAVFCSALKFAEVVLAVRFRKRKTDGGYEGGAHYYINDGLGMGGIASFFCILCVFSSYTIGNMTQVNAAAQSFRLAFGMNEYLCGALCFILILVFCRSGSAIYSFTLRLIPVLCVGYIGVSIAVIVRNFEEAGDIIRLITHSAFTPQAGVGGIIGVVCGKAFRIGITRGVLSNEAGCGTAPIAHASSSASSPFAQGVLGVVEVLFDTLFLCTLTALTILISDVDTASAPSTVIALTAFSMELGEWVRLPLACAMLLFAIASAVGWNYYGRVSLSYLGAGKSAIVIYCVSYAVCAFFGAGASEGIIWLLSDVSIYLMSLINTAAVLMLMRFLKKSENGIDIRVSR